MKKGRNDSVPKESAVTKEHKERSKTLNEFFNLCEGFRKTDLFLDAMRFVGRFRQYAPINAFLIYSQRPDASLVATRSQWFRNFGRRLTETARPIVILAPMGPVAFIYDVSDTSGRPLPGYLNEPYKVTGKFAESTWENTVNHCTYEDKFKISFSQKSFLNAACAIRRGDDFMIEINQDFIDSRARYTSLVHEIAHIYCGHLGPDNRNGKHQRWIDRFHLLGDHKEIEAETIAYLTATRLGLETKSVEYVGAYMKNPEQDLKAISVKTILEVTSNIEQMAKYIILPAEIKNK